MSLLEALGFDLWSFLTGIGIGIIGIQMWKLIVEEFEEYIEYKIRVSKK